MTRDEVCSRTEGKTIHVQMAHPHFIVWARISQEEALSLRDRLAGRIKVRDVNVHDVLLEIDSY